MAPMGLLAWLRKPPPARRDDRPGEVVPPVFTCSTCGRTDLPETGDWDPPICEECDAAINFDALQEEMDDDNDD